MGYCFPSCIHMTKSLTILSKVNIPTNIVGFYSKPNIITPRMSHFKSISIYHHQMLKYINSFLTMGHIRYVNNLWLMTLILWCHVPSVQPRWSGMQQLPKRINEKPHDVQTSTGKGLAISKRIKLHQSCTILRQQPSEHLRGTRRLLETHSNTTQPSIPWVRTTRTTHNGTRSSITKFSWLPL